MICVIPSLINPNNHSRRDMSPCLSKVLDVPVPVLIMDNHRGLSRRGCPDDVVDLGVG